MTSSELPDGFGRVYRRAVFARVSSARAVRLAWVLVDAAYVYRSLDLELGYRRLEGEAGLSGWSLAHARDDLVAAELLSVRSKGKGRAARTHWLLRWDKNVRSWAHVSDDEKRALKRAPERAPERALLGVHVSSSISSSGEGDALSRVRPRGRTNNRGRVTDDELRAIAKRMEAEDASSAEGQS